jgi:hypothetical protein
VKHKINGSFIQKIRIPGKYSNDDFNEESKKFILSEFGVLPRNLVPKLRTKFKRITLQHKVTEEKITIDRNIYFKKTVNDHHLSLLSVIEVKQTRKDNSTRMIKILRDTFNLHPVSFSKYCIGLVMTDGNVKYNNFKSTFLYLQKISGDKNGF